MGLLTRIFFVSRKTLLRRIYKDNSNYRFSTEQSQHNQSSAVSYYWYLKYEFLPAIFRADSSLHLDSFCLLDIVLTVSLLRPLIVSTFRVAVRITFYLFTSRSFMYDWKQTFYSRMPFLVPSMIWPDERAVSPMPKIPDSGTRQTKTKFLIKQREYTSPNLAAVRTFCQKWCVANAVLKESIYQSRKISQSPLAHPCY